MNLSWHLYCMAAIYFIAGCNHFRNPRLYLKIIPPYIPNHKLMNYASGAAEIILGIALCIPQLSNYAAWGIIILLIAIFPANIYMYQKGAKGIPKWALLLRLPMQFALIAWAYVYV